MSFTDHKITQFQHKIADLPDEPQIPADELKSRFDACPEELRQSLNAVCDDAARLEARVEGIVVDTFGDTIDKEMLSDELAADVAWKSDLYMGTYTGDGVYPRTIDLGFAPRMVFIMRADGMTGPSGYTYQFLAISSEESVTTNYCTFHSNGFQIANVETNKNLLNSNNVKYVYFALK